MEKNNIQKSAFFALMLLTSTLFSQGNKQLNPIIEKSKQVLENIQSIEYEIDQKAAKGRYGRPIIKVTIVQQKAEVKDIGFGNAMIKATGTIKERGTIKPFSFAYDGDTFLFEKGKSGVKKYTRPTRKIVMGLLQQHLFMMHIRPFSEEIPYSPKAGVFGAFKYEGEEMIKGKSYHKIRSATGSMMMIKNGDTIRTKGGGAADIFWVDKQTNLPIFYSDKFDYKTISIKQKNKKYKKSFFVVNDKKSSIKGRTYQETQDDLNGEDALKIGTLTPKWIGISQDGKKFSSESLKGKVVLIDFWGTWCPPCIRAMPDIEKLQQIYKNYKDVVIIGISALEKKPNAAENYFKSKGYTYIHIPRGEIIAKQFKVKSYPTLYVLDKEGRIVQATIGYDIHDYEMSKRLINKHLK